MNASALFPLSLWRVSDGVRRGDAGACLVPAARAPATPQHPYDLGAHPTVGNEHDSVLQPPPRPFGDGEHP